MKLSTLKLIDFFIDEIIDTIKKFYFEKNLSVFDAHVGDTLCQIRAYKILFLFNETTDPELTSAKRLLERFYFLGEHIKNEISGFEKSIQNKNGKPNKWLDSPEKLEDFLKRKNLFFFFAEKIFFLLQSKILATYSVRDEMGVSLAIDDKKLIDVLEIGKTTIKKMTRYFQRNLCIISCKFVLQLLEALPQLNYLKDVLLFLKMTDRFGRSVFPCYDVSKILLIEMLQKKIPVLILAHRHSRNYGDIVPLLFMPSEDGREFVLCQECLNLFSDKPCFVVIGVVEYKDIVEEKELFIHRFKKVGVFDVILCNFAKHPQYSASDFEQFADNPYRVLLGKNIFENDKTLKLAAKKMYDELRRKQLQASLIGCCKENDTFFFVKHIYGDILKNQLNNVQGGFLASASNLNIFNEDKKLCQFDKSPIDILNVYNNGGCYVANA